ncbi:glycerophosphodiester phosphodiesterase family protein [Albimonas pacifica]|uniref:Glycerophosphoryl diester phosphodiesterase n=1 Tax=Albimonas pacifica TaxID=1114924 RepID=A0A1I3E1R5_9RHOB|nr:glycerophosphodiester phosphodiesterase family protein [Albimonas pacifica]SFH92631.1 Glycerophosphoryl diester phosphodiesterase [Albimonas pacifica]
MPSLPAGFLDRAIAHRGLHDRAAGVIENSLPAIRAAAAAGYGCEIDLQISADGEAMCFHDDELDRLTAASGPVRARRAAELGTLALTGAAPEARIPSFAQALEAAGRAPLLVEIKRQHDAVGVGPLEARAAELIEGHLAAGGGPVAVMSFDPRAVAWFHDHASAIPRGLVSMDWDRDPDGEGLAPAARADLSAMASFETSGCSFCSYRWRDLPTGRTRALRAAGLPVLCWTTRSPQEDAAARPHVDNVTFEGYRP